MNIIISRENVYSHHKVCTMNECVVNSGAAVTCCSNTLLSKTYRELYHVTYT